MYNPEFQLNNILELLFLSSSDSIIQNIRLTENIFFFFFIVMNSTICLNHVAFTRNKLGNCLLWMEFSSRASIQNNTLIENNLPIGAYNVIENSTIQLNHVAFIQNKLPSLLLMIRSNSSAIIQNNTTMIENNVSCAVYEIRDNSTIQLNRVGFTRNKLGGW